MCPYGMRIFIILNYILKRAIGRFLSLGCEIPYEDRGFYSEVMPSRMAYLVSSAILRIFSLSIIRERWVSMVFTLTLSKAAICFVVFPSDRSWSTSRSRPVSTEKTEVLFFKDWRRIG